MLCVLNVVWMWDMMWRSNSYIVTALVLLWMKGAVGPQCWLDRWKYLNFISNILVVDAATFQSDRHINNLLSALATALLLLLLWWQPENGPNRTWAQVARGTARPQSEWRPQEEQVPEERLPEGLGGSWLRINFWGYFFFFFWTFHFFIFRLFALYCCC